MLKHLFEAYLKYQNNKIRYKFIFLINKILKNKYNKQINFNKYTIKK